MLIAVLLYGFGTLAVVPWTRSGLLLAACHSSETRAVASVE
jgi:hypothetical protein